MVDFNNMDFVPFDSDGDGFADSLMAEDAGTTVMAYDTNGDGNVDYVQMFEGMDSVDSPFRITEMADTDHDGNFDVTLSQTDSNGDGMIDQLIRALDYDQDGRTDYAKIFADTTGNGDFDTVAEMHDNGGEGYIDMHADLDGDHVADISVREAFVDMDGDGVADTRLEWTAQNGADFDGDPDIYQTDQAEYAQMLTLFGGEAPEYTSALGNDTNVVNYGNFDPASADPSQVAGDPAADMEHWEFQGRTNRCAIYAQKFVIEELTGREIDIEELVAVADENGWFDNETDSGTVSLDMNKLLEYYGVQSEMVFDADIAQLEQQLASGNKVIVSIDANQVWYGTANDIFSPYVTSNHAVEVIGIDRTDPEHPMVVLNDSGSPDGCGELVPLEVFEEAWDAGDSQMVVCAA